MTLAMAKQAVPRMVASRKPAGTESLGVGGRVGDSEGQSEGVCRELGLGQRPQDTRTKQTVNVLSPGQVDGGDTWLCQMLGF